MPASIKARIVTYEGLSPAMMQTLRKAAAALMFAILIGAFAVSMGGNNYFDRYTHPTVAKVGGIEITPEQYQHAYQRAVDNLSARAGRRISGQQAKALGLPDQVLRGLIQDAAIDSEAQKLSLGLSKEGLGHAIKSTQYFQDSSGKFSPEKYQRFLQQIGYSELGFEQEFKSDIVRRQIQGIFRTSGIVPVALLDAFNTYTNQQRVISYFTLGEGAAGQIEEPSGDALRSYYEERKRLFVSPELRKVAVIAISPQAIASKMSIPEEELKAEYDAKAANYAMPERRTIEMIPFQTEKSARAAYDELKAKKNFADVAKGAGFSEGAISLGTVSKKELGEKIAANEAILTTAFELKKGEISKPVNGPLSWVILRVPGKDKSFDEVKGQIRDDLAKARGQTESSKLIKAFEDDRAAGVQLGDIAKKLDLPLDEVTITRNGTAEDGKPVNLASVPVSTLAEAAFKSDVGVENEALRLSGGGYAWFDVQDVVKPRQKPFEEVKSDVEASWRKDQIRTKVAEKAKDLVARLSHGETIADVAKSVAAEVKTTPPIKRDATDSGLPPSAISQAFSLGEGDASSATVGDGTSRAVFQVAKVVTPGPLDEAGAKTVAQRLSEQIAEDNFSQYLMGVEKSAGVSVDRKNFTTVAGGSYDSGD
jgi:peptidyl-prolyl cis-trans isomerase D